MIVIIETDELLSGEGLTTGVLVRGAVSIVVVGVRLPTAGALGLSSGLSFVGVEYEAEEVRLLKVSMFEVR